MSKRQHKGNSGCIKYIGHIIIIYTTLHNQHTKERRGCLPVYNLGFSHSLWMKREEEEKESRSAFNFAPSWKNFLVTSDFHLSSAALEQGFAHSGNLQAHRVLNSATSTRLIFPSIRILLLLLCFSIPFFYFSIDTTITLPTAMDHEQRRTNGKSLLLGILFTPWD
jgi:hypothetical protein